MATQIKENEALTRELAEDGYSGVEVRVTPMPTEIIIRATRTQNVLGEKGGRIRELTSVVQKRFKFPENAVELYSEKVSNMASVPLRRLSLFVTSSLEALLFAVHKTVVDFDLMNTMLACNGVLRFVMESGDKGCEDGYMISSGQPVKEYIDSAVRHVLLRQVSLLSCVSLVDCHALQFKQPLYLSIVCNLNAFSGNRVCLVSRSRSCLTGIRRAKVGSMTPLPDLVTIHPPKEEEEYVPPLLTTNNEIPVA
ncbi:hypothetical protein DKX38_022483 [Salix brachista]|uniref:KH type-2 domain-containing protein n=1 Tax=Salix brachista TaxID=2182728 RepID=A0A5N5K2S9_9ROSI|nr:hypothetical protein DKX38_022483 [Salix brachista]